MKNEKKCLILLIILYTMIMFPHYIYASDIIASGTCGDNASWVLDDENVLIISGTGPTDIYTKTERPPWYDYRNKIHTVIINEGITKIREYAFANCYNLTDIQIANGVTHIESFAFTDCSSLISVALPDTITNLDNSSFQNCISLTDIFIPDGIEGIGSFTFENCSSLTEISLPDSITYLGSYAFRDCTNLMNIKLPNRLTEIETSTFYNCKNLGYIDFPDSIITIGSSAFSHSGLIAVELPNNLINIGSFAFFNCPSLKTISIPRKLSIIEPSAFNLSRHLSDVYYDSTSEEWDGIAIDVHNDPLTNSNIHFNCNGLPVPQFSRATITKSLDIYNFNIDLTNVYHNYTIIVALYSNDIMCGFATNYLNPLDSPLSINVDAENADSAKIFLWDSLYGMKPLDDVLTIPSTNFIIK